MADSAAVERAAYMLPDTNSSVSRPYWDGLRHGKLRLQQCTSCGLVQFYPRSLCRSCMSRELDWIDAAGQGEVYSFTEIERAPTPTYQADAPYTIALIDLPEGVRMMSRVVDPEGLGVEVGSRVSVVYHALTTEVTLPFFAVVARPSKPH
jgi:uncharacterized protein